jgi:predicted DNA-binding protein (UPF0251 family)
LTARGFRPIGHPPCKADAITIGLDELEAIRLADVEGLYQDPAAGQMRVSRQTYARILTRARTAVARCLLEEKMLLVKRKNAEPVVEGIVAPSSCPVHGGRRRRGRKCHCSDAEPGCARGCQRRGYGRSS